MSQASQVYGGDEVNAVVLDPGSFNTRVGWSAEDVPSISTPTDYSVDQEKYYFGDESNSYFKPNKTIENCMTDGIVSNWDGARELWTHAISQQSEKRDISHLKSAPLMITEPFWNTKENQKELLEFGLNHCETPAMYIAKSATLSLFSAGRGTGLVVDIGHSCVSVIPVIDGLGLLKSARRSRKAGKFLNEKIAEFLGPQTAQYKIKSKVVKPVGEPAQFETKKLDGVTKSFDEYHQSKIYENFKEAMLQIAPESFDVNGGFDNRVFEFPDGHQIELSTKRFELGEQLFTNTDSQTTTTNETDPSKMDIDSDNKDLLSDWSVQGIGELIVDSITSCDVDVRAHLANNIVITGGTSLIQGFTDRIHHVLTHALPMLKIRLFASGNTQERCNAAWIGGSILASLGTFHQLWVTKQEYEEMGAEQICKKRFR